MRNKFLAAAAVAASLSAPLAAQAQGTIQGTVGVVGGNTVAIEQDAASSRSSGPPSENMW